MQPVEECYLLSIRLLSRGIDLNKASFAVQGFGKVGEAIAHCSIRRDIEL